MNKVNKIIIAIVGFGLLCGMVYASVTIASTNKSSYIPWQGTASGSYDAAHNVGTSYLADSRFEFTSGSSAGGTSVVRDTTTGLYWQSEGVTQGTMIWDSAKTYCANLTLGGESDWRLPNVKELKTILDLSAFNPAIDLNYFTADGNNYWSSTTSTYNTNDLWAVFFYSGNANSYFNANDYYVRCIR